MKSRKTRKVCKVGHIFYKSSDCPVCPECEKRKASPEDDFPGLGAPARRALESAGITSPEQLSTWTKPELLKLHGLGPSSIPKIEKLLKNAGLKLGAKNNS